MKLIGNTTSPFVRKVRIVLAEKKLDCTLVEDDVLSPNAIVAQHNPLGKVPCLLVEGDMPVFDSRVIVEYLDTLSPVGRLMPTLSRERIAVKTWEAVADGLMDAAVLVRQELAWAGRSPQQRSSAWVERQLDKIHAALHHMSRHIGHQPYCHGNHFTLADVAVGCALGYLDFRFPDLNWRYPHPQLARLHDKLVQRPSFAQTAHVATS